MIRMNDRVAIIVVIDTKRLQPDFKFDGGGDNHYSRNSFSFNQLYQTVNYCLDDLKKEGIKRVGLGLCGTVFRVGELIDVFTDIGLLFSVNSENIHGDIGEISRPIAFDFYEDT